MSLIKVEVAYAAAREVELISLNVREGTTALEAVRLSGIRTRYPDIDTGPGRIGIYGRAVDGDTVLRDGDRVEIYRALLADPKEARRRRAARHKTAP
jgi:hypothetical protein